MTDKAAIAETKRRILSLQDMQGRWNNPAASKELLDELEYYECILTKINCKKVLSEIQTCDLVDELMQREGTETHTCPWIPCETYRRDSLPPKSGKYEVTIRDGSNYHVAIRKFRAPEDERNRKSAGFYYGDCWERHTGGIVAWRYLPEPYRPEVIKNGKGV